MIVSNIEQKKEEGSWRREKGEGRMERGEVPCGMIAQPTSPLSILPSPFPNSLP
ncbi:hypothetical protein [Bacteroides sp.]